MVPGDSDVDARGSGVATAEASADSAGDDLYAASYGLSVDCVDCSVILYGIGWAAWGGDDDGSCVSGLGGSDGGDAGSEIMAGVSEYSDWPVVG